MRRRLLRITMVFALLISLTSTAWAESGTTTSFKDVGDDHWAKEAIELMAERGIISGYEGYFRPEDSVSRGEFAKMLVKTLELPEVTPATPYFLDVAKTDWEYTYVETARKYLTGFTSGSGYKFKSDEASVREDMAVAVVKGLYDKGEISNPEETDMSILDDYSDSGDISSNLRMYVAAAINEGLMVGSDGSFNPMGNLTRAESATLLARLIEEEEKVVFEVEEDKVVLDDTTDSDTSVTAGSKAPSLEGTVSGEGLVLEWSQVPSTGFKYYKVVMSQGATEPYYPDFGYAKAIGDVTVTTHEIFSGDKYNGGDFGGVIMGGEGYYITVTAVFDDGNYTSDAIYMTVPGDYEEASTEDKTPVLSYTMTSDGVKLNWTEVPSSGFSYYKVVLSETMENPYYPDYGYLTYISDPGTTNYLVSEGAYYKDGSKGGIGGKVEDVTYYMTVTAVFSDGKYTSNSVQVTVP